MSQRAVDASFESLLALTAAGAGILHLPESLAAANEQVGLNCIPFRGPIAIQSLCAIYRKGTDNPAVQRLLAIPRERGAQRTLPACPDAGPAEHSPSGAVRLAASGLTCRDVEG